MSTQFLPLALSSPVSSYLVAAVEDEATSMLSRDFKETSKVRYISMVCTACPTSSLSAGGSLLVLLLPRTLSNFSLTVSMRPKEELLESRLDEDNGCTWGLVTVYTCTGKENLVVVVVGEGISRPNCKPFRWKSWRPFRRLRRPFEGHRLSQSTSLRTLETLELCPEVQ